MENNYEGYISLAELEAFGRILYGNVEKETEMFHRRKMRDEGRNVLVYPDDVFFVMETRGVPGLAESWYHHLIPNKSLERIEGGRDIKIVIGNWDFIVFGQGEMNVIHMDPNEKNRQEDLELRVQVIRVNKVGE